MLCMKRFIPENTENSFMLKTWGGLTDPVNKQVPLLIYTTHHHVLLHVREAHVHHGALHSLKKTTVNFLTHLLDKKINLAIPSKIKKLIHSK